MRSRGRGRGRGNILEGVIWYATNVKKKLRKKKLNIVATVLVDYVLNVGKCGGIAVILKCLR